MLCYDLFVLFGELIVLGFMNYCVVMDSDKFIMFLYISCSFAILKMLKKLIWQAVVPSDHVQNFFFGNCSRRSFSYPKKKTILHKCIFSSSIFKPVNMLLDH